MTLKEFRYPEEQVCRTVPKIVSEADHSLFAAELGRSFGEISSHSFRRLWILPDNIFFCNRILPEMYFGSSRYLLRHKLKLMMKTGMSFLRTNKSTVLPKVLILTDQYSCGFFHWFADVLQKLEALEKCCVDLNGYVLTVPAVCHYPFVRESLKVYGIKYKVLSPQERVLAEEAVHVPLMAPAGNFRPDLMCHMRERFHRFQSPGPSKRRVYITRAKAKRRRILNEDLLLPVLDRLGFEIVAMEELPFWEQYRLSSEAAIMVSLHGAGLTHMLWMSPGAKVLEIRSAEDRKNNCYFSLASALGLVYYYAFADKADGEKSTQLSDFIIDIDEITEKITGMVSD